MKKFYRTTLTICLLIILFFSFSPYSLNNPSKRFAYWLSKNPDQWEISVSKLDEPIWVKMKDAKSLLIGYIKSRCVEEDFIFFTFFATTSFFCFIGWLREKHIEKKLLETSLKISS